MSRPLYCNDCKTLIGRQFDPNEGPQSPNWTVIREERQHTEECAGVANKHIDFVYEVPA